MEELNFDDLAPVELLVTVAGKKYLLREASGDAVAKWRNAVFRAARMGPDGKPVSIDGMADTEPFLVSLCLWEAVIDPEDGTAKAGKRVDEKTIRAWPNRLVAALSEKCKEISRLEEFESEEAISKRIEQLRQRLEKVQEKNARAGIAAGKDGYD